MLDTLIALRDNVVKKKPLLSQQSALLAPALLAGGVLEQSTMPWRILAWMRAYRRAYRWRLSVETLALAGLLAKALALAEPAARSGPGLLKS